jgi:hypothetical protein
MCLRDLSEGMQGEDVRAVQQGLNEYFRGVRPELNPNGVFDRKTREAVEAFQLANPGTGRPDGKPDGVVGDRTRRRLFALVVVTATVVGYQLRPPRSSLQNRINQSFPSGHLTLDGPLQPPSSPRLPDLQDRVRQSFSPDQLQLGGQLAPVSIPRLPDRIAAPVVPEIPVPTPATPPGSLPPAWKYDHVEVVPGGQTTFPNFKFSGRTQNALSLTAQMIFARGPSEGAHLEFTPGLTLGVPIFAEPGDGSAWAFNPFVQITDVDRLGALGLFHWWQPYAQVGFQGAFARNISPTLTLGAFPVNLGFDVAKFLTLTIAGGAAFNLNLDTGAVLFGPQFSFGANFKFGAPSN